MAAFRAVFTFGGVWSGYITAYGSLDLKQEFQIKIKIQGAISHPRFVVHYTLT
jgi:hypothetical protein